MTLKEVQKFIAQGEGQIIEFKLKANHPDRIIKEVVAFSNSNGGHLFIGVDDEGSIIGLKDAEETHYVMEKAMQELCRPKLNISTKSYLQMVSEQYSIINLNLEKRNLIMLF